MAGRAQIYLVTPPFLSLDAFGDVLAELVDSVEVACVRLALASADEDEVLRAADGLRAVCHARDVPLVLAEHFRLAGRLGLDGVHLPDGPRRVRAAREALGANAIVGAHARASRHDGMTAAEIGADYVSFGPVGASGLGDGGARVQAAALDHVGLEGRASLGRSGGRRLFRQLHHLQRAGAVGETADEAAFLQRRDQAVDARLGRQVQRLLHLVEGRRNARLPDALMNEHQEFVLFLREHGAESRTRREPLMMFCKCSG